MKAEKIEWKGLNAVQIDNNDVRMIIVTDFGPRISFFGKKKGRNLFFWDETGERRRKNWIIRGGHRVWIATPGADESEISYAPDNAPCSLDISDSSVTVTGANDDYNMTERGVKVELDGDKYRVTSFVRNTGDMLLSCGVWGLTCTLPDSNTRYEFPLGDGSGWDTFRSVQFRKWGPLDAQFGDSQFVVDEEKMTITPVGRQAKLMFNIPQGKGSMINSAEGFVFTKTALYDEDGVYPDGCNWAIYIGPDNFMVEMENMGPMVSLKPGRTLEHIELWSLSN